MPLYDDPTQGADPSALRAELIRRINAKSGLYKPEVASQPVAPPPAIEPEPSGFGKLIRGVGKVANTLTSGREAANVVGGAFGRPTLGSDIQGAIESIPVVGRPLGWAADIASSPLTIATAGFGGLLGGAARAGLGGAGRFIAPLIEPLVEGSLGARVGASLATDAGSQLAQKGAKSLGLPEPLQVAAGLAGGAFGLRTAGNYAKEVSKIGGLLPSEVEELSASANPVDRMTAILARAKRANKDIEAEQNVIRGQRSMAAQTANVGITDPDIRAANIGRLQAGELGVGGRFKTDIPFAPEDVDSVKHTVSQYYAAKGVRGVLDERRATTALNDLFLNAAIPTDYDAGLLQKALGTQFGATLKALGNTKGLLDVENLMGIPRAIMSSADLSIPFRQGVVGIGRREFWQSLGPMVKAMHNEKYAKDMAEEIATDAHPMMDLLRNSGVVTGKALTGKEELYSTAWSEILPGVRQSERAAVTFLNKQRADMAKNWFDKVSELRGTAPDIKEMNDYAHWVSLVTGRGNLNHMPLPANILNDLFFSPRFISSRIALLNPKTYMNMEKSVRQEAIRDMVSFFGVGAAGLSATAFAAKSGLIDANVETDWRSSDFGKVRLGNARIDPWGGFQPFARYMAQLASGERKNSAGDIVEQNRAATLENFVRGKLAPIPSFLVDALTGTNFIGQEVDVNNGVGLDRAAAERLAPMFVQDMADAIADGGWRGAAKALPAGLGVGVQTYNSVSAIRGAGAQEMFQKDYAKLTGLEKAQVNEAYKDQISKQSAPAANTFAGVVDTEGIKLRGFEQDAMKGLMAGQLTNADFTAGLNDANTARINAIRGARQIAGDNTPDTVLDGYYGLREQATGPAGVVDYELLDQLQADFMANLSPDDRRVVDERTAFAHAPEVKWWVDAKKTIADSNYYKLQADTMDKLHPLLDKLGAGDMTYNQLQAASRSGSPTTMVLYQAVLKRIDQVTDQYKQVARLKNPALDKALTLVYGQKPILDKLLTR